MTRRHTDAGNAILSFEDIALNRATFELSSGNSAIRLANKEFQMIELLLEHPGQVISAERFMEKIWGYDSDAEMNVVWVYISYLRKKLAKLGSAVQIKVVRNVGYLVEATHD